MCLIAYVPAGKAVSREDFDYADETNNDGIGVMSRDGIVKFFGKKHLKRARRYVAKLTARGWEHAIHWRYATHGAPSHQLTHPFELPGQAGWLMHNGVLRQTSKRVRKDHRESDTSLFVAELTGAPKRRKARALYWDAVGRAIGSENKFVVMHDDLSFRVVNEAAGNWLDGIWYSNTYSLYRSAWDFTQWGDSDSAAYWNRKPRGFPTRVLAYDSLSNYGSKPALPSGPTLDSDGDAELEMDLGADDQLWACTHGVPWSDYCDTCDGKRLPGLAEATEAAMLRSWGDVD